MVNAIIIGCSSGLGLRLVKNYLENDWATNVVALTRNKSDELKGVLDAHPGRSHFFQMDVTDQASISHAMNTAEEAVGSFDHVIYNAGVAYWAALNEVEAHKMLGVLNVKVVGLLNVSRYLLPKMASNGVIYGTNSAVYKTPSTNQLVYKAAAWGMTAVFSDLRKQFYDEGLQIQVGCIYPGRMLDTNLLSSYWCPNDALRQETQAKLTDHGASSDLDSVVNKMYEAITRDVVPFACAIEGPDHPNPEPFLERINSAFPSPH